MDGDPVHIGIVHKPNDLITEEFSIVLRGEVGFSGFTGVELQGFTNPLPQDVEGRVRLHHFRHCLLNQRFHTRNPVAKGTREKGRSLEGR